MESGSQLLRHSHDADYRGTDSQEDDQVQPPEALAMILQNGFFAAANGTIFGRGDFILVRHFQMCRTWALNGGEKLYDEIVL